MKVFVLASCSDSYGHNMEHLKMLNKQLGTLFRSLRLRFHAPRRNPPSLAHSFALLHLCFRLCTSDSLAPYFSLSYFRARSLALQKGENSQDRTASTRQPGRDSQKRTVTRAGQPERNIQNETARAVQPERNSHNGIVRTGQPERGSQNGTARTGQPERDSQNGTEE
jgi:hypothetical protein